MSYDPQASQKNIVQFKKIRITLLTDQMLRIEYSKNSKFEDRASFAVVNRKMPDVKYITSIKGNTLTIKTFSLVLSYIDDSRPLSGNNLSIKFLLMGKTQTWKYGMKNPGNLKGTFRTLDGYDGDEHILWKQKKNGHWYCTNKKMKIELDNGLLSKDGWAVIDDSSTPIFNMDSKSKKEWVLGRLPGEAEDFYFLAYGHDYKKTLHDASFIFGRQVLPPRYALGYWYSKYWAYTEKEIYELINKFNEQKIPLDVLVIDMDWHLPGWTGYTWDKDYFPDHKKLLQWLRTQGLKTTLNLHPADGVMKNENAYKQFAKTMGINPASGKTIPFDCTDPKYMEAYFKYLHHPLEKEGVDFWWMDWQQGGKTKIPGLDPLPWLNKLHWDDQASSDKNKRPISFSRYAGPGSGRYPIGFSGDTYNTWPTLKFQFTFTPNASNILYGYWSHDIGGHMPGKVEPELYARWMQFAVFSPVLRTHTTKNPAAERRFWEYSSPYNDIMTNAVKMRYKLMPYIYTEMKKGFDTGVSIMRPMYYNHPESAEAYKAKYQYMFGDNMLVAPIGDACNPETGMSKVSVWLPAGTWIDTATGEFLKGDKRYDRTYMLKEIPVFVRPGSIIPGQENALRAESGSYKNLLFTIYPGPASSYIMYEDDGTSNDYLKNINASVKITQKTDKKQCQIIIEKAKGSFKGFLPKRPVKIIIPMSIPPANINVNGKKNTWTYDGENSETIIDCGILDLTKNNIITCKKQNIPENMINGIKGLMSRLDTASYYNRTGSTTHPIHKDERLIVRAAQTGNRITLDPSSFKKEILQLKKIFPKTLTIESAMAKKLKTMGKSEASRADCHQKAAEVIRTALKQFG